MTPPLDGYRPVDLDRPPDDPVPCFERGRSVVAIQLDELRTMKLLRTHWSTGIVTEEVAIETRVPVSRQASLL